jgi:hypothetical protein
VNFETGPKFFRGVIFAKAGSVRGICAIETLWGRAGAQSLCWYVIGSSWSFLGRCYCHWYKQTCHADSESSEMKIPSCYTVMCIPIQEMNDTRKNSQHQKAIQRYIVILLAHNLPSEVVGHGHIYT